MVRVSSSRLQGDDRGVHPHPSRDQRSKNDLQLFKGDHLFNRTKGDHLFKGDLQLFREDRQLFREDHRYKRGHQLNLFKVKVIDLSC